MSDRVVPHPHVTIDPAVLDGAPHLTGTRIPVRRLWASYRAGTSIEALVRRYPEIGPARILSAFAFAFDHRELVEKELAGERQGEADERPALRLVGSAR